MSTNAQGKKRCVKEEEVESVLGPHTGSPFISRDRIVKVKHGVGGGRFPDDQILRSFHMLAVPPSLRVECKYIVISVGLHIADGRASACIPMRRCERRIDVCVGVEQGPASG